MQTLIHILMAIALIGVVFAFCLLWRKTIRSGACAGTMILSNIGEGVHNDQYGGLSLLPDTAIPTRYVLAKTGVSPGVTAAICTHADIPIGVFYDTTLSVGGVDDLTIPVSIRLFGSATETRRVAINSTVNYGDFLIPDDNGYVKTDPMTANTRVDPPGIARPTAAERLELRHYAHACRRAGRPGHYRAFEDGDKFIRTDQADIYGSAGNAYAFADSGADRDIKQ